MGMQDGDVGFNSKLKDTGLHRQTDPECLSIPVHQVTDLPKMYTDKLIGMLLRLRCVIL